LTYKYLFFSHSPELNTTALLQVVMTSFRPKRVAIIGAGISGVVTAAHFKNTGLEVTVFERNNAAGGVW
jgi:pyruvate/2-oxoglutarate dehydrogenase complex dihydrolipoamide dehydrogenase (E3) component